MSFHVRVLRRVLLVGSVLTLTGIHHDGASLPIGWRLSRLLPISLVSATLALNLTKVALSHRVHEALVSLSFGLGIAFGLLLLFWLMCRRKRLNLLLRRVAKLKRLKGHLYKPGDTAFVYRQMTLLISVSVVLTVSWTALLSVIPFRHLVLLLPLWVPQPQCGTICLSLVFISQVVLSIVVQAEMMMFTLFVAGLADAAALQLRLIQQVLITICCQKTATPTGARSGQIAANPAGVAAGQATVIQEIKPAQVAAWPGGEVADDSAAADAHRPDSADAAVLRHQSERYRLVHRLVSDTADTFSAPLLWLHADVAVILLLAGYLVAVQLSGRVHVSNTGALFLVMAHWFACLAVVAVAGSRLIQQSEELRDVVAKQCWSARMSSAVREELQVLLEQTRTPLALDVWGLFSVQKSVLLSVLSFVLTYFVIMLQMIR